MSRWPAILGVVGVDFASKPAISLAVAPRRRWWRRQTDEDEQPVDFCATLPGSFAVTLDGFVSCGCTGTLIASAIVGLSGMYTVTETTPGLWVKTETGTFTITRYSDDGCAGTITETLTAFCSIIIQCVNGAFAMRVLYAFDHYPTTGDPSDNNGGAFVYFATEAPYPAFGVPLASQVVCGDPGVLVDDGTIMIDL